MHASDDGDPPYEPVPGSTRTVRDVEALPDGRRVTWYASASASFPGSPDEATP